MAGSNACNLLLIALLDMVYRKGSITNVISHGKAQTLSAWFAFGFTAIVAFEILMSGKGGFPTVFGMSFFTGLLGMLYFVGMYCIYKNNPAYVSQKKQEAPKESLVKICSVLGVSAVVVVIAAVVLANAADRIAVVTGLGRTFVGSLFLAMATSLPEMVVTISALSLGQLDLAIGNIFGSNMTNMFLIAVCDVAIGKPAILGMVSVTHVVMLVLSCIMTVIVLKGLARRYKKAIAGLGGDSWLLLAVYGMGMLVLYILK
jgi:cation:H+ antiporter